MAIRRARRLNASKALFRGLVAFVLAFSLSPTLALAQSAQGSASSGTTGQNELVAADNASTDETIEDTQGASDASLDADDASKTDAADPSAGENEQANAIASATVAPVEEQKAPEKLSTVYVNGLKGDDANPGTKDAPVKTFDKARSLILDNGASAIYVTGTLSVYGTTATWDLDGASLMRDPGFHGNLVEVEGGASLTLSNIVLDGNKDAGAYGSVSGALGDGGSLVYESSSTVTAGSGAVLQNNRIDPGKGTWYPESGGGIFAENGNVNIEGGTVTGNSAVWGGGIMGVYDAAINVSAGTISNNTAVEGTSTSPDLGGAYGGRGGGICLYDGGTVNLSGGTVTGNDACNSGGGISVGTYFGSVQGQPRLNMTGGSITGNSAGSGGGGIFVQAGFAADANNGLATYGVATLSGGYVTNNTMTNTGDDNSMFGGGGIYVNGYNSAYTAYHNGELYLYKGDVSGNTAKIAGGGYAACPVSRTEIELTNGAVFYDNAAATANEIYILASYALGAHSGNPPYVISPSMLGGGAYNWLYNDGSEVPLDKLSGTLIGLLNQSLSLDNNLSATDASVQNALSLATTHISGNTSETRGGGIGSNGTVFIGKSTETIDLGVNKVWNDDDNAEGTRPASIKVELYRDGAYVGFQEMIADSDGTWPTVTFNNLPEADENGNAYTYTIRERAVDGYTSSVTGSVDQGFTVTNTQAVNVPVKKAWVGAEGDSATFHLIADGVDTGNMLTLTAVNGWQGAFNNVPRYNADGSAITYTVTEDTVPGYMAGKVSGSATDGFTVTNVQDYAVPVTKVWNDGENKDNLRPDSVTVHLLADGKDTGRTVSLSADDNWTASFDDLAQYNTDGSLIDYTVSEDAVEGYSAEITGDDPSGFTITNTHTPSTVPPGKTSNMPKTGDALPLGLLGLALVAGEISLAVALRARRRAKGTHRS